MLRLLKQMKAKQWIMALLCVALILGQIYFDLRLPDYMSDLTLQIKTPGSTVSDVLHTGLEMLACTLISAVMAILCGYLNAQVAAGFSYHIRESVFQKVADFGQKEMLEFSVPSLINRTTNDITQIQMFVAMGMQTMIKAPVMAVWAVIKIVNKSWTLSVITAGFVVALLALMLIVVLVILPRVKRVQKLTDNINLISRENLTGHQRGPCLQCRGIPGGQVRNGERRAHAHAAVQPARHGAADAGGRPSHERPVADDLLGRRGDCEPRIRNGPCRAHFDIRRYRGVRHLRDVYHHVAYDARHDPRSAAMAQVSAVRINEVLDAPISLHEGKMTEAPEQGTVEFRDVSFRYPSSSGDVLEHVSFRAKQGETVALIGATRQRQNDACQPCGPLL